MVSAAPVMNAAEVPATKATGDAPVQDAMLLDEADRSNEAGEEFDAPQRDVMTRAIELARAEDGAHTQG